MSEDIEIPVIYITDTWTVDDIETEEDCDDAFALLTAMVASIEGQIDEMEATGRKGESHHIRAKAALRFKKAALQIIQSKRGRISRAQRMKTHDETMSDERKVLDYIKLHHPEIAKRAFLAIRVAKFTEPEAAA